MFSSHFCHEMKFVCIDFAICDLVHNFETVFHSVYLPTASKIFSEISVMHRKRQMTVFQALLLFQKRFPDAVNNQYALSHKKQH